MSTIWLTLITILSLSCTALSGPGSSGPVWKDIGRSITIQCSTSLKDQESLSLQRGLQQEVQLLFLHNNTGKRTIKPEIVHRLEIKGDLSKLDIIITNLTVEDTGVYWCMYKKLGLYAKPILTKGHGSVLLVVKGAAQQCAENFSQPSSHNTRITLVLAFVLTSVLLISGIVFFIWIIPKIKAWRVAKKPRRATTNDVYEDMRATLRR